MPARKTTTGKTAALNELRLAKCWSATASADLRRGDCVSSLSCIVIATRALNRARKQLREGLPS